MASAFDDLTRRYLMRHYEIFDRDKVGRVPLDDLIPLVRVCGATPTEADIEPLKLEADPDGRGSMNFDGFCRAMMTAYKNMRTPQDLKEAFLGIDPDSKGLLSQHELRYILTTQGDCLSTEEMNEFVEEMRSEMDMEGNFVYTDMVYKMTPEMFR
ncbi:calmodulin [Trypanosoma grayi]|uniref:calmodulin n=1 Tax=Trypanosoma grayi TaxID=71804 RepID=UPI0004F44603|nr:calmodulin [Trypanosoma grayi]KEG14109.1 calmodulin [Trypanosoma grayi]